MFIARASATSPCIRCGRPAGPKRLRSVSGNAVLCEACALAPPPPAAPPIQCPDCGLLIPSDAPACPDCGASPAKAPRSRKSRPTAIAAQPTGRACVECGYSLLGLKSLRCPECGHQNRPAYARNEHDEAISRAAERAAFREPLVACGVAFALGLLLHLIQGSWGDRLTAIVAMVLTYPLLYGVFWACTLLWLVADARGPLLAVQLAAVHLIVWCGLGVLGLLPLFGLQVVWLMVVVVGMAAVMARIMELNLFDSAAVTAGYWTGVVILAIVTELLL